jgi:hypothetical protein
VLLGAAAAAVVAAAFAGGHALAPDAPTPGAVTGTDVALRPVSTVDHAAGDATMIEKAWGTDLLITLDDMPPTGPFRLEVVGVDGSVERAASWGVTPTGHAVVEGASALKPADVEAIRIVGPSGALLVGHSPG